MDTNVIKFPAKKRRPTKEEAANIWDELSRRFYGANRSYLKRIALGLCYGLSEDPWLDHMVRVEFQRIILEWRRREENGQ